MDLNLEEKVAIVTGGGGAICGKIAGALALEKARVVIWDVNLAAAEKKAEDISLNGGNAAAVECDVLDKTSAVKALNSTISLYGTVGILINGAGGSYNLRPDRFF